MRWFPLIFAIAACRSSSPAPTAPSGPPSAKPVSYIASAVAPALPVPVLPTLDDDEPKIGGLVGIVVDTSNEPLAGATLIVTSDALAAPLAMVTDEDGSFVFDELPPDEYLVTVYYIDVAVEYRAAVGDELVELSPRLDTSAVGVPDEVVFFGCGGTSQENTYIVDGIDTTGLTFE